MSELQPEWEIDLSSWIIQDGNYGDFETNQMAEFALEFIPKDLRASEQKEKYAKLVGPAKYEVNGEVVYLAPDLWVIDFGLLAYEIHELPKGITVGNFVTGEILLGIDHFSYFERLHLQPGMLPMIYSWKVNSIRQQTAPFLETMHESGQKIFIRDQKKLGYKTISKTDGWADDGGQAEYVLNCTKLDVAPVFKIGTQGE